MCAGPPIFPVLTWLIVRRPQPFKHAGRGQLSPSHTGRQRTRACRWGGGLAGWLAASSFAGWLSGWLVGCLTGWLAAWLADCWFVCWLTGWLAGWLPGCWFVCWLAGWLAGWLPGCLAAWLASLSVAWLADWLAGTFFRAPDFSPPTYTRLAACLHPACHT